MNKVASNIIANNIQFFLCHSTSPHKPFEAFIFILKESAGIV